MAQRAARGHVAPGVGRRSAPARVKDRRWSCGRSLGTWPHTCAMRRPPARHRTGSVPPVPGRTALPGDVKPLRPGQPSSVGPFSNASRSGFRLPLAMVEPRPEGVTVADRSRNASCCLRAFVPNAGTNVHLDSPRSIPSVPDFQATALFGRAAKTAVHSQSARLTTPVAAGP